MQKIKDAVDAVRRLLGSPAGREALKPYRKVIAATLGAALVAGAREVGLVDLPPGWSEAVAAAILGYLVPESGDTIAREVAYHVGNEFPVLESQDYEPASVGGGTDRLPDLDGEFVGPEPEDDSPGRVV